MYTKLFYSFYDFTDMFISMHVITIFVNLFQIEHNLATHVGAGSKVKEMTAVNTVSIS